MKKTLYFIASMSLAFSAVSCNKSDGLGDDSADLNNITEEQVYADVTYTRRVLFDLYARTREYTSTNKLTFSRMKDMNTTCCLMDNATDDGVGEMGSSVAKLNQYASGAITASMNPVANTHPWNWYYTAIRQANGFLENVDNSVLEEAEKIQSKAEARFLRALYYHELYRWFGPFVISEKREDPFDKTLVRADEKTCVEWLVNEFTELAKPSSGLLAHPEGQDYGRASIGAALAYKARTLLYAASPLHSESGVSWKAAADAALEMIQYADNNGYYDLYVDSEAPEKSYAYLFNTRYNNEYIFFYNNEDGGNGELYNLFPPFNPWNTNKELSTCVTQEFVDAFDMLDGSQPFNYDPKTLRRTGIRTESGYDDQKPYANRDPRLDQTVLHDGMTWLVKGSNVTVDISTPDKWVSGYFVCKFLDDRVDHMNSGKTTMNFPSMRYAEVLLNYAEAINEAEDNGAAREKAVAQLNRIRKRAGITKDLKASDFTQDQLRERIRRERRVELSWEEHRFFDIRRWKIAKDVIDGLEPTGITRSGAIYSFKSFAKRSYADRMNLSPIPVKDVNSCPGIWQNPGY
ncbi:MAG: RagB/SusD family nutrient uptake outer membrane protein [Bacteroidales bacterium]|nr:RagB/SusD family nutrient uptake outer membrane protein [Bacteroidales bacterium]